MEQKEFKEKPNTGRLMPATVRKSENSPAMWGVLNIDREFIKQLLSEDNNEEYVAVRLSAWKKPSKSGTNYLSLTVNTFNPQNSAAPVATTQEKDPWE